MAIQVGDAIPNVNLKIARPEGIEDVSTEKLFAGRKVVLFAVPGAFTPTCSAKHLPGFVDKSAEIRAKGVDAVVCLSVNDAFVMGAWGKEQRVGDKVSMIADGSADFTKAIGLELDGTKFGMGVRSQRYAMVVENGIVKQLFVDAPMKFEVSSAESVLKSL